MKDLATGKVHNDIDFLCKAGRIEIVASNNRCARAFDFEPNWTIML
jgi:hypothetical protein